MREKAIVFIISTLALSFILWIATEYSSVVSKNNEVSTGNIDDQGLAPSKLPPALNLFPDTELGQRLRDHLKIMALPTENPTDADRMYDSSLAGLAANSDDAVLLLVNAYEKVPAWEYFDRWLLIAALGDLHNPKSYSFLARLVFSKVPSEKSSDLHHFSTQGEEHTIHMEAINGLVGLARQGKEDAEKDLLSLALDSALPFDLKVTAIKGYLRAGENTKERIKSLKSKLPQDIHGVITLKITPQAELDEKISAIVVAAAKGRQVSASASGEGDKSNRLNSSPPTINK